jgi:GNAT superfamily N-acetyltransferase
MRGLEVAGARGDDSERYLALLLDEPAQGRGLGEAAIEAIERIEQRGPSPSAHARASGIYQWLGCPKDHLTDELLARPEPAVDRGPAEPELSRDRLHIDPPPA